MLCVCRGGGGAVRTLCCYPPPAPPTPDWENIWRIGPLYYPPSLPSLSSVLPTAALGELVPTREVVGGGGRTGGTATNLETLKGGRELNCSNC